MSRSTKIKICSKLQPLIDASINYHKLKREFDRLVIDVYGHHYSDLDCDFIIDSIDYGDGNLKFSTFDRIMKTSIKDKYKKE